MKIWYRLILICQPGSDFRESKARKFIVSVFKTRCNLGKGSRQQSVQSVPFQVHNKAYKCASVCTCVCDVYVCKQACRCMSQVFPNWSPPQILRQRHKLTDSWAGWPPLGWRAHAVRSSCGSEVRAHACTESTSSTEKLPSAGFSWIFLHILTVVTSEM